jgi:hypothetical protein
MATTKKKSSIKTLSGERWKELELKKGVTTKRYAISNFGRIVSFKEKVDEGYLLRPRLTQGYPSVTIGREANRQNYYLHRLVAAYFTKKPSTKHGFVIHLDHVKHNNKHANLKWVTHESQIEHALSDPNVVQRQNPAEGPKLNVQKVRLIKRALKGKNQPTLKALAKQFKVSDMQIHRIKTGENWAHVEV